MQTWIDNPVLGDTEVVFTYSDYKDFGGVRFPSRILRVQGEHPVLDLTVSNVTANAAAEHHGARRGQRRARTGRRHRGETRQRRLLPQGRHASQRRHRSEGSHRRGRGPAERGAVVGGDRQGEGDDPEQADQIPGEHPRAFRSLGRRAHLRGRRRHDRDARRTTSRTTRRPGPRRTRSTRTSSRSRRRRRRSRRSATSTC